MRQRERQPQDRGRQRRADQQPRHQHRAQEVPRVLAAAARRSAGRRTTAAARARTAARTAAAAPKPDDVDRRAQEDHRDALERARRARPRPRRAPRAAGHPEHDRRRTTPPASRNRSAQIPSSHIRFSGGQPANMHDLPEVEVQQRARRRRAHVPAERRLAGVELRPQQPDQAVGEERREHQRADRPQQPAHEEARHARHRMDAAGAGSAVRRTPGPRVTRGNRPRRNQRASSRIRSARVALGVGEQQPRRLVGERGQQPRGQLRVGRRRAAARQRRGELLHDGAAAARDVRRAARAARPRWGISTSRHVPGSARTASR